MDSNWRIKRIEHHGKTLHNTWNWPVFFCLIGFLATTVFAVFRKDPVYLLGSVLFLALVFLANIVRTKSQRKDWVTVKATLLDREIRRFMTRNRAGSGSSPTWVIRVKMRFEYQGQTYEATPDIWTSLPSEQSALDFLESCRNQDGSYTLHIDPDNPCYADLDTRDIKERILY